MAEEAEQMMLAEAEERLSLWARNHVELAADKHLGPAITGWPQRRGDGGVVPETQGHTS